MIYHPKYSIISKVLPELLLSKRRNIKIINKKIFYSNLKELHNHSLYKQNQYYFSTSSNNSSILEFVKKEVQNINQVFQNLEKNSYPRKRRLLDPNNKPTPQNL